MPENSTFNMSTFRGSLRLRITGWQWSVAELPVRVDAVVGQYCYDFMDVSFCLSQQSTTDRPFTLFTRTGRNRHILYDSIDNDWQPTFVRLLFCLDFNEG